MTFDFHLSTEDPNLLAAVAKAAADYRPLTTATEDRGTPIGLDQEQAVEKTPPAPKTRTRTTKTEVKTEVTTPAQLATAQAVAAQLTVIAPAPEPASPFEPTEQECKDMLSAYAAKFGLPAFRDELKKAGVARVLELTGAARAKFVASRLAEIRDPAFIAVFEAKRTAAQGLV